MSFTYSSTALTAGGTAQTVATYRLAIGDTVAGAGVLPDGANYADEELLYFANNGGTVAIFAALARTWARLSDIQAGPLKQSYSQVAKAWQATYDTANAQTGGGFVTFRAGVTRQDGYAYRAGTVDVNP